jgi:tripartite-type tricarboxylate transporter receptor subunit TctC
MIGTQAFIDKRDAHSLLFTTHSTFTVVPLLYDKVSYDPVNGVSPISLAVEDFLAVVAAPNLAASSLSEFVGLAREKPGQLNFFAVPGVPYLAYLAFQRRAGIETTFVGYTNPAGAITDLAEGRIHVAVLPLATVLGQARSGKIKLLAVTNSERTPAAPSVPTVTESGYQDLSFGGLLGMFGPKDMSPSLRGRIATDVNTVLTEPETKRRLQDVGLIARGTTPEEFATVLTAQRAKWSAVAREHNIKPQQSR